MAHKTGYLPTYLPMVEQVEDCLEVTLLTEPLPDTFREHLLAPSSSSSVIPLLLTFLLFYRPGVAGLFYKHLRH